MSKKNPTVLESFKLAETLLGEIKNQQAKSLPKKEEYNPPPNGYWDERLCTDPRRLRKNTRRDG